MGIPESLQEKQKKAVELDMIERRNQQLQEQIKKLEQEIEDNKQKLPKVQKELDEKLKQAIQLKIDVDPDQPLTKLRDKYSIIEYGNQVPRIGSKKNESPKAFRDAKIKPGESIGCYERNRRSKEINQIEE